MTAGRGALALALGYVLLAAAALWGDAKHERNRRERGFGFDHAVRIVAGPMLERARTRRAYGEVRIQALGKTGGDAGRTAHEPVSRCR